MPGRGPAPKHEGQRRRRNVPERGEWTDLEPLASPVLPEAGVDWPAHVQVLWSAWRDDPVSQVWSQADRAAVMELARRYDDLPPNEQRLRMDGLGLTPKGKRDLRLRVSLDSEAKASKPAGSNVRRLRVVADENAA